MRGWPTHGTVHQCNQITFRFLVRVCIPQNRRTNTTHCRLRESLVGFQRFRAEFQFFRYTNFLICVPACVGLGAEAMGGLVSGRFNGKFVGAII
jgi:hypothetical protein